MQGTRRGGLNGLTSFLRAAGNCKNEREHCCPQGQNECPFPREAAWPKHSDISHITSVWLAGEELNRAAVLRILSFWTVPTAIDELEWGSGFVGLNNHRSPIAVAAHPTFV